MKNISLCSLIVFLFFSVKLFAVEPKIDFGGYIDTYIATDNANGSDSTNPNYKRLFSYISPKKNEFSLNTAQITAKISIPDFLRSNITLHFGDLHKSAYVTSGAEMPVIQQANAGIRIFDKIWVDAGYFLTHIGSETLLPKDNWLTTHSILTYYEPFFQSGVRASYESDKFTAQFHILNGNGIFEDNNQNKTFGAFLGYTPNDVISASYAGVYGNEEAGNPSNAELHQLHNFVVQVNPFNNFSLKGQFDYARKNVADLNDAAKKISGTFIGIGFFAHYQINKQFASTFRVDYMDNSDGVYSTTVNGTYIIVNETKIFVPTTSGIVFPVVKGLDYTLGVEYKPTDNSYIRLEGRNITLDDKYKLFKNGTKFDKSRNELILNFGVWLN